MNDIRKLDFAWVMLVLLSVSGAGLGGAIEPGFGVTLVVAAVMGIKVRIVCAYFMELGTASRRIRQLMYAFCYGMPLLVILTSLFGPSLARLTGALV
ncbi:cytochrome C oxidase subunit IV family protein [Aromatoleum diolicum]|uniref:Thiosulfate reductase n=1 Tax=Aromatoleum diolicum TaxID=75796 RepID=A0ABX1QEZ2_9RHOO|nr:cytochrome C oxidase subunit IV family protein [Aromatoleum diolicum]NMG76959.1 hypothetical protein [Aromatoleum diolicum]